MAILRQDAKILSQIVVAKSSRCISLSAVYQNTKYEPTILVCKETAENGE